MSPKHKASDPFVVGRIVKADGTADLGNWQYEPPRSWGCPFSFHPYRTIGSLVLSPKAGGNSDHRAPKLVLLVYSKNTVKVLFIIYHHLI